MRKLLKIIGILTGSIILLLISLVCLLTIFINPNRFKPIIAKQITKASGRPVLIDQNLSWSIFPHTGIKIDYLLINNPSSFKEPIFAELKHIVINLKLKPLLYGKFESNGISLEEIKLNLIKNINGEENWHLNGPALPVTPLENSEITQEKKLAPKFFLDKLNLIENIDIKKANITWKDDKTKQIYFIKNAELHAHHMQLTQPFPVASEFDFSLPHEKISGHASLTSDLIIALAKQQYIFHNSLLKAKFSQGKLIINAKLAGTITTDLKTQTLSLPDLKGKIANVSFSGTLNTSNLTSNPSTIAQIHLQPFNLDEKTLPAGKNIHGDLTFKLTAGNLNALGKFKMDELQVSNLKMTAVNLAATYQNGLLQLNPITANFYQGTLQSLVKMTVSNLQISLAAKIHQVQLSSLQEDLGTSQSKLKLTGLADVDLQATTFANSFIRNLNGTTHFQINKGALVGLDLDYLIDNTYALATHKNNSVNNTNQTRFNNMKGTAVIQNGVLSNQDLALDSTFLEIRGKGKVNLVDQNINYTLANSIKKRSEDERNAFYNLFGASIPVSITGNLHNPLIRLDTETLLKIIAERQIQRLQQKAQEKIQEKIKEKISDQAADLIGNLLDGKQ